MSKVYLLATPTDDIQAHDIRHALTDHGYSVEPQQAYDIKQNRLTQQIGCVALLILWNSYAAQNEWVTWHSDVAQRLQQSMLVLRQDDTPLPSVLQAAHSIDAQQLTDPLVAEIMAALPPTDDLLADLLAQAGSFAPKQRKAAIDQIATKLDSDEGERLSAILEELARHDTMNSVQEKAQALLDAQKPAQTPTAPERSRFMIKVVCANYHLNRFDRRIICRDKQITRSIRMLDVTQSSIDTFTLPCQTPGCGALIEFEADCEGLRE